MSLISRANGFMSRSAAPERAKKLSPQERLDFYGFIRTLLANGESLRDACEKVADTLDRQTESMKFGAGKLKKSAKLYRDVAFSLRKGRKLSRIFEDRAPTSEVLMIMAGEKENLADGLRAAEVEASATKQIRDVLTRAVVYPCFLFLTAVGAMKFVESSLLPAIKALRSPDEWTSAQTSFFWLCQNISTWLPIFIVLLVLLGSLIAIVNRKVVGKPREYIQWLPPFNVIRHMTGANYLTTISSLVMAGESFKNSLSNILKSSSSAYLNHYVNNALERSRTGEMAQGAGAVIGDRLFTPWVMVKLEIFGTGKKDSFADRMGSIAAEARESALESVLLLSKILNVSMLVVAGGVIGYAVITLYGTVGSIQGGV